MNYKEKYENLIEQLKKAKEECGGYTFSSIVDKIVPELKESEDEEIRKLLIEFVNQYGDKFYGQIAKASAIAWLEKQGEKRSDDNTESKFKDKLLELFQRFRWCNKGEIPTNGDIIEYVNAHIQELIDVNQNPTDLIEELQDYIKNTPSEQRNKDWNELESYSKPDTVWEHNEKENIKPKFEIGNWITDGNEIGIVIPWSEGCIGYKTIYETEKAFKADQSHLWHIWTINDAKDGDVLAAYECYVIFKEIDDLNIKCYCTYHYMNNPTFFVNTLQNKTAFHPATKEQRDLLFQKVRESGYEWNAEKKELKKIEQTTWSEEDEYQINTILHGLDLKRELYKKEGNRVEEKRYKTQYDWLKSLKDKIQPQQKQEWSEEDEKILKELVEEVKDQLDSVPSPDCMDKEDEKVLKQLNKWMNWLKSLKDRVQLQPKQEWSEDDEDMIELILYILNKYQEFDKCKDENDMKNFITCENWLKSLKPQNHWKPSEKQMEELARITRGNSYPYLSSLYNDLKLI